MSKKFLSIFLAIICLTMFINLDVRAGGSNDPLLFKQIIVVASRYPQELLDAPVSSAVITEKDINEKNIKNAADLLRNISGVYIKNYGVLAGTKTIRIRGSNANQVLVMVDGQAVNNSLSGVADLSQIPVEIIKRIEISKGPASSLYGANALGGVVNIITRDAAKSESSFTTSFGSYNTRKYSYLFQKKVDKIAAVVSIVKKKSDGFRENSDLDQQDVFAKFNFKRTNNSRIIFTVKNSNYDFGVPGSLLYPSSTDRQSDNDTNLNLTWQQNKDNYDFSLAIYNQQHKQVYEPGYGTSSQHDSNKTGLDFTKTDYYSAHTLTYGGSLSESKIDSTDLGEHDNLTRAVFVQDKWEVTTPWALNLGVRYDDQEQYGSEISPRLGVVYSVNKNMNIYSSLGKAYRAPIFRELYWPGYGNPDLKPETAIAYETGLRLHKNDLQTDLSYFYRDVKNLITSSLETGYIPYNIDKARTTGFEFDINKTILKNLAVNLNYTYLDSRNRKTNQKLAPLHNANLELVYNLNDFMLSINNQLVADRQEQLQDYAVTDLKISKRILLRNRNFKLAVGINNLFDKDYQVVASYPMPGRNYTVELKASF